MKSNRILTALTCLTLSVAPTLRAGQIVLHYEWAPTLAGPFVPVPPNKLKLHPDGSVSVVTEGPQGFFRLVVQPGGLGGGGAAVPVGTLDSLPEKTVELARGFLKSLADEESVEGEAWRGAALSPFYIPLTSAWNDTGVPDMAELKIIGACEPAGDRAVLPNPEGEASTRERGFLLVGLSRKCPPIVGYAVDGPTPAEVLLEKCEPGSYIPCIRRFGPMSLVAEDENMNPVANDGLLPMVFTDQGYEDNGRAVSYTWDSEVANPRPPEAPPAAVPMEFPNYRTLVDAYQGSDWLRKRNEQRAASFEFDWQALEGTAPSLTVGRGERRTFLEGEFFSHFNLDDEDNERVAVVRLGGAAGGVVVEGTSPGVVQLTLFQDVGPTQRFIIAVQPAGAGGEAGGGGQTGIFTTSQLWEAGSKSSQPRFDQREDLNTWCPNVGCGPVMLALQVTWAEHYQNVPSAYWTRDPNASLASRRASLRNIESPLEYVEGVVDSRMKQWYDHFHDGCNVACWPHNGAGSALPHDVGDTLIDYASYIMGPVFPVLYGGDTGGLLVGGSAHWEVDVISDDWDESGVRTANAIKAGRPGGVLYYEHMHYCVAYRYRKTVHEFKVNGTTISKYTQRSFRVNTGWGNSDRVWNAYDIDGCFLLNLHQKRNFPNP